ncbi:F0F1 ATP synthase subunit A [Synechococcus sp. PCC 7336]|uniref:F0F1 ATP synthase subunit A n=1 Tax=Synechococcus sp. PCC 7336 TaxID=195250 RepID=UPI0003484AE0|nr:F0F1 ATP synthase subunit A [Synechococcus sp. PCC 7336]
MEINPDNIILLHLGDIGLNATILFTWLVMAVLVVGSWLVTRNLSVDSQISNWQNVLEIIVESISGQIRDASEQEPEPYLPFIGTLFLFIAIANLLAIVPFYISPAASLSTTSALALCVFVAVPLFGIRKVGLLSYLENYIQPTPLMLPFTLIGEISRTASLAIRLFGNIMSGNLLVAILVSLVPLFIPPVMQAFGLLIGVIQAYVFSILAMVYITSGMRTQQTLD